MPFLPTSYVLLPEPAKKGTFTPAELSSYRASYPMLLSFYTDYLEKINPNSFRHMDLVQKQVLEEELMFAHALLTSQFKLDQVEGSYGTENELTKKINYCSNLLAKLNPDNPLVRNWVLANVPTSSRTKLNPFWQATGIPTLLQIPEKLREFYYSPAPSDTAHEGMSAVNEKRLYWVWAGNMAFNWLESLSDEYIHNCHGYKTTSLAISTS